MPSQNITALTDYAGGQSPADLIYLGRSPFGATDDRKSTLNDFLSVITKNITDGALRFGQFAAPALSAANAGAIYFDNVSKTFQVSENGGAYVGLITLAAGSTNEIQYNGGAGAFAANAAYTYDSITNTVAIGAAGLTGKLRLIHTNTRALTIQPGVQSAARTFTWMTGYGNANQAVITDGFGNLSYGDFIPYPLPGVGDEVLYNAAGSIGASSQFLWNDTARVLSFVTGPSNAQIYFNTSVSTANIKFQDSAGIPGSQAGLIFPYIGGDQTSGHGLWWSDGTYLNTSRFNLQLGFNFQGAASSTSPLKIRKATGTSADGNIVFAFFPDSGFFDLQPFGVSAGETSAIRFSELAANGTNYIEFKAPDALTANTTFTWPNGAGSAGQVLTTNGSNTLSWSTPGGGGLTVGTTAIASGTAGRILYETAGNLLGEIAGSSVTAGGAITIGSTLTVPVGTAGAPTINFTGSTTDGIYQNASGSIDMAFAGVRQVAFQSGALYLGVGTAASGSIVFGSGFDTGYARHGVSQGRITNGSTGGGQLLIGGSTATTMAAQAQVISGSASRVALRADSAASATVALNQFYLNTNVTNSVALHSTFSVDSSAGAGAAGLGGRLLFQLESSTTDDQDAAAINWLWTTATHASRTAAITFSVVNNAAALTEVFRIAPTALTLADAVDFVFNTTTGTKIATATGQKIGFWNASPVVQPTSAALTNNVTSGGTANIISDYSNLTVYATDAGTIRDNFYQLASKLKEISDALRLIGILG